MQDIGGCRAVLHGVREVFELANVFRESTFKHKLDHVDDYIAKPQTSGYRGERTPAVADTPSSRTELKKELRRLATRLDVAHRLQTYGTALQTLEQPSAKGAHYYLLKLDPGEHVVTVTGFKFR